MPDWLPDMAVVNPWTDSTYEMLYAIFCRDIRDSDLRYTSHPVWIFPEMENGKEKIFWHLTTRMSEKKRITRRKRKFYPSSQTDTEPQRMLDLRRCERLPWVKPLIEHPFESEVLAWDYEEGDRTIKTYIWIKDYDFVVIMKKYRDGRRRLITSFHVDKAYKREVFKRKYANRLK